MKIIRTLAPLAAFFIAVLAYALYRETREKEALVFVAIALLVAIVLGAHALATSREDGGA